MADEDKIFRRASREALPLKHDLNDYVEALSGRGPLAPVWADKPHRLVYALVTEIVRLRDELDDMRHALGVYT